MYSLNSTFPTYLFFKYDEFKIFSLSHLEIHGVGISLDEDFETVYKKKLFELDDNSMETFLNYFPSIVFNNAKIEVGIDDINLKKCKREIVKILNTKIDLEEIKKFNNDLSFDANIDSVNHSKFYSDLFIFIYKIFFIELSKNIYFFLNDKLEKIKPVNFEEALKKYIKYENDLISKKTTSKDYDKIKVYVDKFRLSLKLKNNKNLYAKLFELEYYIKLNDKNSILKEIVSNYITFNPKTSTIHKNRIERQIFKIISKYYFPFDNPAFNIHNYPLDDTQYVTWYKKIKKVEKIY